MDEKRKTPRHMVSLTPLAFVTLEKYKDQLEKQLMMPMTYSQALIYAINNTKEKK